MTGAVRSVWWWIAIVAVVAGAGLDLLVSGHGTIKPGHMVGFAVGSIAGLALKLTGRTSQGPDSLNATVLGSERINPACPDVDC
jgi:hypothetical protein